MPDNANISVSDRAANRIREIMAREAGPGALRISVAGGGCSGFRYDFEVVAAHERGRSRHREGRRARGHRSGLRALYGGLGDRLCGRSHRRLVQNPQPQRNRVLRLRHVLLALSAAGVLKIATWNVNSIKQREAAAAAWLKQAAPDMLCLQELKCQTEAFPRGTFEDLGYNCAVLGQKSFNGVAILSKYPIDETITRAARRRRGRAGPLYRGGDLAPRRQGNPRRLHLCAERQPRAIAQARLQARLAGAAQGARANSARL